MTEEIKKEENESGDSKDCEATQTAVIAMKAIKKGQRESGDSRECEAMRKMFIGGINIVTTEEAFADHFGQYGDMVDRVIIKDVNTGLSRGFGFVAYETSDSVEKVFQSRPHVLDGKTLDVKRAMPREYNSSTAHSKVTKLFIGGIGPDLTPEELREYIEGRHPTDIGTVDNIDFLKDKETGKNKGFGFLECSDTDFADRLTICETSFLLQGKTMCLKKAEPKGEGGQRSARGGRGGNFESQRRGRVGGGSNSYPGQYNQYPHGYNLSVVYPVYGANPAYLQPAAISYGRGRGKRFHPY